MSVAGRVAVIGGVGGVVSEAIARCLAQAGAEVVVGGEEPSRLRSLSDELRSRDRANAPAVRMVPGDAAGTEELMQTALDAFGRIDIAVSAWERHCGRPLARTESADVERIVEANLLGPLQLSRAAARVMQPAGYGRIVHLSSRAWLGGETGAAFAAAEAGLVGLTRVLAWELVRDGITVNCVAPGVVDTEDLRRLPPDEVEDLLRLQPVRRPGAPEEVGQAVLFFAADESRYITGQTLYVCGGKSALSSLTA